MQPQDNQAWEVIKLPGEPKTLYHWACQKKPDPLTHKTEIKVSEMDAVYKLTASAKVAGAELFREGWTLEMVNRFLVKLGFPELPASKKDRSQEEF